MSGTESATCEAQACRSGCLRSPSTKGQRWARRWFTCFTHPESATKMAVPQARRHRTDCETMVANIAPQLTRTTYLKRLDSGASNFAIPAQQLSSRKYVYVCCVRVFADVGDKMYASPIQHATILQRNPRLQFPAERNQLSAARSEAGLAWRGRWLSLSAILWCPSSGASSTRSVMVSRSWARWNERRVVAWTFNFILGKSYSNRRRTQIQHLKNRKSNNEQRP